MDTSKITFELPYGARSFWRIAMKRQKLSVAKILLAAGSGIALTAMFASQPASAQVGCPPGYYYSYGSGCVPAAPGYADVYGPDYGYAPPVYDSFGLAFG